MKTASLRIPQCLLLTLSTIFAGMSLPLQLASRSKAQILIPERKPKPEQADNSPLLIGRFSVEEGKSRNVAFSLDHDCKMQNLISIKSEKKFFQLKEPTDSVVFRPGSNQFFANIDATKLKQRVYPVKVNFKCLDCIKPCSRKVKNLLVEINVIKPSSQTPQSTPQTESTTSTKPSNGAAEKDDKKAQELFESGPQFPESFDMNNFKAFFIIKGGWPLVLKYELEEGAMVSVMVRPLRDERAPMRFEFHPTGTGQAKTVIFMLPESLGAMPQTAQLTFKAVFAEPERRDRPVNFNIHSLGVGPAALGPQNPQSNLRQTTLFGAATFEAVSYELPPFSLMSSLQAGEVAINGINLTPSDALNASQGSQSVFQLPFDQ